MFLMYLAATRPTSTTGRRSWRLRLALLGLLRCFLPACDRFSLPWAVTRKRFLEALCVFILGMVVSPNSTDQPRAPAGGHASARWRSRLVGILVPRKVGVL